MLNFKNINYLKKGIQKQQRAYKVLMENRIMTVLEKFKPVLVGTIPINIALDNSDLDNICYFSDANSFKKELLVNFSNKERFAIYTDNSLKTEAIVANFFIDEFRKRIIALKKQGHKTEPAFALELGLEGNPYKALLALE